jgi:hypothetical protein
MTLLHYRGVSYDSAQHEQPAANAVVHVYRGHRYSAPLRHEAVQADPSLELHYRGHLYHQHAAAPQG